MSVFGLGKNSPIVLSQSRSNFEALIDRHGQWCRWRTAKKCTCITTENEPDVHCEKCGGSGDIYDYQKTYEETLTLKVCDNIIELPVENEGCEVLKVYDTKDNEFKFEKAGCYIEIKGGPRTISRNELVTVLTRDTVVAHIDRVVLEHVGNGYYRVPGIESVPSKLEGVYYRAPGDVIAVERIEKADGEKAAIVGFRQNIIQVDCAEATDVETLVAYGVDFVRPFKFIVLSQNLNKEDFQLVNAHSGDAVCTYPYMFDVAENDVITVLSGTMTSKIAFARRSDADDDMIPEFFVAKVSNLETKDGAYREGTDFVIVGTNRIHWLGENKPAAGTMMSLAYRYYPTYRVAKNIPNLRTSEDQRIPRKVVLQLFSAFQESRRVNQNG
jgi:hypothetical protein